MKKIDIVFFARLRVFFSSRRSSGSLVVTGCEDKIKSEELIAKHLDPLPRAETLASSKPHR